MQNLWGDEPHVSFSAYLPGFWITGLISPSSTWRLRSWVLQFPWPLEQDPGIPQASQYQRPLMGWETQEWQLSEPTRVKVKEISWAGAPEMLLISFWNRHPNRNESRVEEGRCHQQIKARTTPERLCSWVPSVFSFYTLEPQGGVGKQASFNRSLCGSQ